MRTIIEAQLASCKRRDVGEADGKNKDEEGAALSPASVVAIVSEIASILSLVIFAPDALLSLRQAARELRYGIAWDDVHLSASDTGSIWLIVAAVISALAVLVVAYAVVRYGKNRAR